MTYNDDIRAFVHVGMLGVLKTIRLCDLCDSFDMSFLHVVALN